ncbi:dihydrolipoyl dehydrogenase [Alkalilimnicola ehrlichii]|uniref:Dihydrolipoyl dehydrogenase n=1 Tax=Alkalilimnicola ehrlichii TaxID=351052 RepID=A0A3E0WF07_9GAMM|nr:dihydrolipoyl dehydrogenase [Alkalilimnicola ehrlichii]RFA27244.1 dihydrolipoyl dehydrogenase [Alkalilimnicola ehrlichii]RFA31542.1 dihydrolipoyl dehydrogenase [Alkalilimnicola ehrlichii]
MAKETQLTVPDIGDFDAVAVIEVLIAVGDSVEPEQSLITLESDKATMEVPASSGGRITDVKVKVGDKVKQGDVIALIAAEQPEPAQTPEQESKASDKAEPSTPAEQAATPVAAEGEADCDVLVLGAGPGGYTAAFRAADLGLKTVLVERYANLGGVCLNVGCIPSKALLHAAKVIDEVDSFRDHGLKFGALELDLDQLRGWKEKVVKRLTGGLAGLAKQRKVDVVQGEGQFASAHELRVTTSDGERRIRFRHCIIAAGSRPIAPPGFDLDHPRIMDSTAALELEEVPKRLLVVGGGIIGLEMATVYQALGAKVTVAELGDRLMPGADPDMVRPLRKRIDKRYKSILLKTKASVVKTNKKSVKIRLEGPDGDSEETFDRVLVAVGRQPNSDRIGLETTGLGADERGIIAVDEFMRTRVEHIFAIGDIVGQPMLAHKASHEGKVAAEVIAGHKHAFDARTIPAVAYTDPEVAWAGVTEEQAKAEGIEYDKAVFPWAANGRSLSLERDEGITKLLFDKATGRIIGGAITGPNAGDLIAEVALAIEMGCEAEDIALTVHPHPTLSETVAMAAEAAAGTLTDLYMPKR